MPESQTQLSSGNTLMDLRLAILRTIAQVWEDDQKPDKSLREEIIGFNPIELSDYLAKNFGYNMSFENFGIKFIKGVALWNFYGDNEWTKPENETIVISIPSLPTQNRSEEGVGQYRRAEMLMEYYQYFPSFFGSLQRPKETGNKNMPEVLARNAVGEATIGEALGAGVQTDYSGNDYDLGVSEDSFLSFGAVVSKLIALAWQNPTFLAEINYPDRLVAAGVIPPEHSYETSYKEAMNLIANPPEDPNSPVAIVNEQYYSDILNILKDHFDFEFPWMFDLLFIVPPKNLSFWTHDNQWRFKGPDNREIIRNLVHLEIPVAPTSEDTSNVSLALARYNAIGPAYPFTCS